MYTINVDELIKYWEEKLQYLIALEDGTHPISFEVVLEALKEAPRIEVEPVTYAKWLPSADYKKECSSCGFPASLWEFCRRCPNCGAKMSLEGDVNKDV